MTILKILHSDTPGASPSSLQDGQIAINQYDGKLFWQHPTAGMQSAQIGGPASVPLTRNIFTGPGLAGGGALSSDLTITYNIPSLTAKGSPDPVADYVIIYDGAGAGTKKATVGSLTPANVSSFNGRQGIVVPVSGDYNFPKISGTVAAAQLPTPTVGGLGGIQAVTQVSHKFVSFIDTSGVPQLAQPTTADISGLGTAATHAAGDFLATANNLSDVPNPAVALANLGGGAWPLFGSGLDGNVTISGAVTLTRDMYYNNLTLMSGAALNPNGFRIFVAGTLDISSAPSGAIIANGSPGSGLTGGSGGIGGASGGSGGTGSGGTGTASAPSGIYQNGGSGGSSAAGSAAPGGGGLGGSAVAGTAAFPVGISLFDPPGRTIVGSTVVVFGAGIGGSGGSEGGQQFSTNGGNGGGGGGGGGSLILICATIARGSNATSGIFQAKGAAGANGQNAPVSYVGGGSGGGGGGGGFILIIVGQLIGTQIANAIDISGGAGGAGGNGGIGGAGADGSGSGYSGQLQIWKTSGVTVTLSLSGTSGSTHSGSNGGAGATANVKQVAL